LSRGINDPFEPVVVQGDLPTMAEVDEALQQLFAEIAELKVENKVLREIIGASIGSAAKPSNLTGL
jgi:ABC-type phosphate/phosphonate transport system substrate-binding protein